MNNAVLNICVQIHPSVWILTKYIPKWLHILYFHQQYLRWLIFASSLPTCVIVSLIYYSHSNECKVILQFLLCAFLTNNGEHLSVHLLAIPVSYLVKCYVHIFVSLLIWSFSYFYWVIWVAYKFCIHVLYLISVLQALSSSL